MLLPRAKLVHGIRRLLYRGIRPFVAPERILENPYVAAKMLSPLKGKKGYYIIPFVTRPHVPASSGDFPVPPPELWEGYGETQEEYLSSGREHIAAMLEILGRAGATRESLFKVLDFGCAAGRMLRFCPCAPGKSELWGVDIKADHIAWCQQHLSPPFLFATTTTMPHLPFEDNYFDLIYSGSVFTHVDDLPDAWFLELRRAVRKGGHIYITIQDKHTVELLFTKYKGRTEGGPSPWPEDISWFIEAIRRFDQETHVLSQDYGCFSLEAGSWGGYPVPQVFHDVDYVVQKWSRFAGIVSVTKEAYWYQTGLLFRK